jgi:hypothetical protein
MRFAAHKTFRAGLSLLGLFALSLALSSCDNCGDLIKGQGSNTPMSCKSDGPQPG